MTMDVQRMWASVVIVDYDFDDGIFGENVRVAMVTVDPRQTLVKSFEACKRMELTQDLLRNALLIEQCTV